MNVSVLIRPWSFEPAAWPRNQQPKRSRTPIAGDLNSLAIVLHSVGSEADSPGSRVDSPASGGWRELRPPLCSLRSLAPDSARASPLRPADRPRTGPIGQRTALRSADRRRTQHPWPHGGSSPWPHGGSTRALASLATGILRVEEVIFDRSNTSAL